MCGFMWPVPGFVRVSSGFGYRVDPVTGGWRMHRGIDISRDLRPPRPILGAGVVAVADGTVVGAGCSPSMGLWVEIDHGEGLATRYMHHLANMVVRGQAVRKGDVVATVGSTGRSTGPHLHFEVVYGGRHLDPLLFVCASRQEPGARADGDAPPPGRGRVLYGIAHVPYVDVSAGRVYISWRAAMRGKAYGYARCSTTEKRQDVERQVGELYAMGASFVVQEYESGSNPGRKGFKGLVEALGVGDTLMATEVSRVTRTLLYLCEVIEIAKAKELLLRFGTLDFDFGGGKIAPFSLAMLQIMGVFAELERNLAAERINSGLALARSRGVRLGRPRKKASDVPVAAREHLGAYLDGRLSIGEYTALLGVSRPTALKYIRLLIQETREER